MGADSFADGVRAGPHAADVARLDRSCAASRASCCGRLVFNQVQRREPSCKLRPHRAAGQLQQNPTAHQGQCFQRAWFQTVTLGELPSQIFPKWPSRLAIRTRPGRRRAARTRPACSGAIGSALVRDARCPRPVGRPWARTGLQRSRNPTRLLWQQYSVWQEQEPGSGGKESAENTIRSLAGYPVHTERVTGAKQTRWEPWEAQLEAGNVRLLKADWNRDFIDEHCAAPLGKYKDQIDAASGAFAKLAARRRVLRGDLSRKRIISLRADQADRQRCESPG